MTIELGYGPVDRASGLRMDGWFVWCGSAIEVDGVYHLFASRWPETTSFPEGYRTHSEIVHATAPSRLGPYAFRETVIGKRAPGRWDSGMAHNPAVYRTPDGFALFYNASDEGERYRQIGVATAASIDGPWVRGDEPLDLGLASDANNPAALVDDDGGVLLIWRDLHLRVIISRADQVRGPYTVVNEDVWPGERLEDFCLFRHGGEVHLVFEDNAGSVTGHERWGGHLVSPDGIRDWRPGDPPAVYEHNVVFTDGTTLDATRRERPWLLIERGAVTALFTSIYDGERAWNQPVPVVPPFRLLP